MLLSDADPLTISHQQAQLRVTRAAQRTVLGLWSLMDFYRLDESAQVWLPLATKSILDARYQSALLSAVYYSALRIEQVGEPVANAAGMIVRGGTAVPATTLVPDEQVVERVASALRITGPVTVKRAVSNGMGQPAAMERGLGRVLGAVQRQVLDGGRQTTGALLNMEPTTTYYQRVASAGACKFCDMLASRGPVYTARTGDFSAHDSCGCTIEPKFRGTKKRRSRGSGYGRRQWTEYQNVAPLTGPSLPVT